MWLVSDHLERVFKEGRGLFEVERILKEGRVLLKGKKEFEERSYGLFEVERV
jgi:hypothetical protein